MSWWDDAVNAVADGVEAVVNGVAEVVTDAVETAGNAAQDGLDAVGGVGGGIIGGVAAWAGGVVAGVTNLVGAAIKGVFGIVGGVVGGLVRAIGGFLGRDEKLWAAGWADIWISVAGAILAILGEVVSVVQRVLFFVQTHDRPLTKEEKAMLRIVFQNSLSLYNIRLIPGQSGVYGWFTQGAFTLDNTIYLNATDLRVHPETLVHECVHVWQYQNFGTKYVMGALGAQIVYGRTGGANDAYDWTAEPGRGRTRWLEFNQEAQAELIEEVWTDGSLSRGGSLRTGEGAFYEAQDCEAAFGLDFCIRQFIASSIPAVASDGMPVHFPRDGLDHTALADEATTNLRGRVNIRWSRNLS
ncbi:MAG: hypothetical protein ACM3JG_16285 [Thiohalocapsa sp.]